MTRNLSIVCQGLEQRHSVANVALHHAEQLKARGWQVRLLSDSFPCDLPLTLLQERLDPLRFNWLRRFCHLPNALSFSLTALLRLQNLASSSACDAVLFHSHPDAAIAGRWLQRRYRLPYALVTHGVVNDRPKGTYSPQLTWLYKVSTRPAFAAADCNVALAPAMAELASRHGARPHTLRLIPNGIDPAEIGLAPAAPLLSGFPEASGKLLFLGSLAPVKGLDILLQACALLRQCHQPFSLTIAGSGTPAQERHYRQQVNGLRLGDQVTFIGRVPRPQLGALLQCHHFMVVPSLSEPLPTVVLEAMIAGCPVIGSDVGGIPFLLNGGKAGGLVPPASAEKLAATIQKMLIELHTTSQWRHQAHQRASSRFSWPSCGEALSAAMTELMAMKA